MPACLLSLGSNLGEREATLIAALGQIDALPDLRVARQSSWHRSPPLGGPTGQDEYLNAAVVVETTIPPLTLLYELQGIETRLGRERTDRWGPRTIDIDLLLYGSEVAETDMLILPHLRMSFRRFVLQPSVEIAPRMLHPTIGWPLERLLLHLNKASDQVAIVSPSLEMREQAAHWLASKLDAREIERPTFPTADRFWPHAITTLLEVSPPLASHKGAPASRGELPYAARAFPKLSILLDAPAETAGMPKAQWSAIVRRPGRGPTLRLQTSDTATVQLEVVAAAASVWPDLGSATDDRLE